MGSTAVEEKIKRLPDAYVSLVNNYVDELLEKANKINSLRGILSECADEKLRLVEKGAWEAAAVEKHRGA